MNIALDLQEDEMTMITDCDCKQEDNYDFQALLRVARAAKEIIDKDVCFTYKYPEHKPCPRDRLVEALKEVDLLI